MDEQNLSISAISDLKLSQIQSQIGVTIQKKAIDQQKVTATIIEDAVKTPEPGKGARVNLIA